MAKSTAIGLKILAKAMFFYVSQGLPQRGDGDRLSPI